MNALSPSMVTTSDTLALPPDDDHGSTQTTIPGNSLDHDSRSTPVTDPRLTPASVSVPSTPTPRRQGDKSTGGTNVNSRVLWCSSLSLDTDYDLLYSTFKRFGKVLRIKLSLASSDSLNGYITYNLHSEARAAFEDMNGKLVGSSAVKIKIISYENVQDGEYDFIPSRYFREDEPELERPKPKLSWFVASYKPNRDNMIKGIESIEKKIGFVPEGHVKRYGRNILIKAGDSMQSHLLSHFRSSDSSNIDKVEAHKSFNISKGVIYSQDLYDFPEEEILARCPSNVFHVRKLRGSNFAIVLTFSTSFLPDYIVVSHTRISVRPYKRRPRQCFQCYAYGHVNENCNNASRCRNCSGSHDEGIACESYCFNCNENGHSPSSSSCPRFQFEQAILETAHNEKISIGSAKRLLMGANKDSRSTYAKVVQKLKSEASPRRFKPRVQTVTTDSSVPSVAQAPGSLSDSATPVATEPSGSIVEDNSQPLSDAVVTAEPIQLPSSETSSVTVRTPSCKKPSGDRTPASSGSPEPKRRCHSVERPRTIGISQSTSSGNIANSLSDLNEQVNMDVSRVADSPPCVPSHVDHPSKASSNTDLQASTSNQVSYPSGKSSMPSNQVSHLSCKNSSKPVPVRRPSVSYSSSKHSSTKTSKLPSKSVQGTHGTHRK